MRLCVLLLFAVSLLTLCEAQGTIVTSVFVLKGRDLLLELHDDLPENFTYVDWRINETVVFVRFKPSGKATFSEPFTGRLEVDGKKFSVKLKNVEEADSGVYSAVAVTDTEDKPVAKYNVTVQASTASTASTLPYGWVIGIGTAVLFLVVVFVGLRCYRKNRTSSNTSSTSEGELHLQLGGTSRCIDSAGERLRYGEES